MAKNSVKPFELTLYYHRCKLCVRGSEGSKI